MCGIVGRVNFNQKEIDEVEIRAMMQKIKHRGPDDEGIFIDKSVGLGFVRLSIIDLSEAGHQPMFSDDKRFVITFNGEVYNYIELRDELKKLGYSFKSNSDTEVVLKAYEEWGESALDKFNGMWAFVIYDTKTKELFGARDRFGVKPFYYYIDKNSFIFGSEIKALKKAIKTPLSINEEALFNYLLFNRTDYSDKTFYSEIFKVPHSHSFRLKPNGEFKLKRWYNLKNRCKKQQDISPKEYLELFKSSLKLRMRSDVPIGVCLSGGIDSSSIVATLSKELNIKNLRSFSAVYKKGDRGDEREYIEEMREFVTEMNYTTPSAKSLFKDLEDFIRSQDEPFPTTSIYAQYKVMELAKKDVKVTLDGQGADEQLAGYTYFYGFYFKELLKSLSLLRLFEEIYSYFKVQKSLFAIKAMLFFLLPSKLKLKLKVKKLSYIKESFYQKHNISNILTEELYGSASLRDSLINHFEYKLEHLLKWEDLNSMRFSIEARVPFLDYRLVEQSLSLNSNYHIQKGVTKYILRESMKSILPEKIRKRYDKIGFATPEANWFREKFFREKIENILKNPTKTFEKYIDTKVALDMYHKHLKKEIDCSKDIWKWINLDLWLRENRF
jgi:asparagine synthase (glutamine-hydrolysing)